MMVDVVLHSRSKPGVLIKKNLGKAICSSARCCACMAYRYLAVRNKVLTTATAMRYRRKISILSFCSSDTTT